MYRTLQLLTVALCLAAAAASAQAQIVAGPISNPANGHHYFVIRIANYQDYSLAAQNIGGYPVVINNATENTWIHQNLMPLVPTTFDYAYIGLTDEGIEGDWRWVAGVTDTFTNWNAGEPNNGNNEDYATMRRMLGNWNDLPAPVQGNPLPYAFVEANPIGSEPTGIQHGPICDPATGSIYYMLTNSTFDGADQFAMNNLDGRLVTIDSYAENTFITRNLLRLPGVGSSVNIGLTDRVAEGSFQWIDGSGASFRLWWSGEPNNAGNEDYVYMVTTAGPSQGFWFDAGDAPRQSIVEVRPCPADFDRNGVVSVPDIFSFLSAWFSGCP